MTRTRTDWLNVLMWAWAVAALGFWPALIVWSLYLRATGRL